MDTATPSQRTLLSVSGMTCSACVGRVERGLLRTPGVQRAAVNLVSGTAVVEFDPARSSPAALASKVTSLGYDSREQAAGSGAAIPSDETRAPRTAAIGSLAVFVLSMVVGAPLMHVHDATSGVLAVLAMPFHGILHSLAPWLWDVPHAALGWVLLALHLPVVALWVRPFVVSAWKAAKDGAADMNTLVTAGTVSAFVLSLPSVLAPQWLAGHGLPAPLWFESVSGVVGFVGLGKWLEARAKSRSRGSLHALASLIPSQARLLDGDQEQLVAPERLLPGDLILILPGERLPADGLVEGAPSLLDESHLTGEPLPREVVADDAVQAGSLALQRPLRVRVQRSGEATTVERIASLVEQAQSSKAPLQRTADRLAEIFAPLVLALALLTALVWFVLVPGNPVLGLTATISVLVAACPCAMGLAVPSALTVSLGRAARLGILVRDAAGLEALGRATLVVFDKTGTLTEGKPRLERVLAAEGRTEGSVLALAALAEAESTHPLAGSVLEAAKASSTDTSALPTPTAPSTTVAGQGVELPTDQGLLRVGRDSWVASSPSGLPTAGPGESLVHVSLGDRWIGSLGFADTVRPDAVAVVAALRSRGIRVALLSGDGSEAVDSVADRLGIDDRTARATPETKADWVKARRERGEVVVMVGDGINDAAALAQADAGLALQSGTAVAFECAQAVVRSPASVVVAIDLGRATVRTVRGNLAWAFGYNILLLPVAAGVLFPFGGWLLSPVLAGAAMSLSSVSVMAHSLRLLGFRPRPLSPESP